MKKKITTDDLARMIAKGFENTATRQDLDIVKSDLDIVKSDIKRIDGRIDRIDNRLEHMDARIARVEMDVAEIRGNLVRHDEFEDLLARVKYLESKLGIVSGK